jgi:WD40 repeat protein
MVHIINIDSSCVTLVGDRLMFYTKSKGIEVRLVHTGQVVHRICLHENNICYITPVSDHSDLIVTGHYNGDVHLWDIGAGTSACECMNECRRARAPNCATCE